MQEIQSYSKKDVIVMKLLHYFITVENYSPIILHGVKDEIWLENQEKDYKIIRIVSDYIHNNEQYEFDLFKTQGIVKTIKKKTFNFTMNTLSIFVNLGESVDIKNINHIDCAAVKDEKDLSKYDFIYQHFPNIGKKLEFSERGVSLFMKITNDINQRNIKESQKAEEIFSQKEPIVTYILMGLNIVIFLLSLMPYGQAFFINNFATNGLSIRDGQIYRLITGTFIHVDVWHIVFNMYALKVIGSQIENYYGKWKYLLIYIMSGIMAGLLSIIFSDISSIGASGAIFGLLGALLYFGYHYRVYLGNAIKTTIIPIILLNLLIGFIGKGIDNAAHIGGLVGGILISMAVGLRYKDTKSQKINGIILTVIYIAFLVYVGIISRI